jgi:hypothetical protein
MMNLAVRKFAGDKFSDNTDSLYASDEFQADQPAMQTDADTASRPDNLSIDFEQLSISDRSVAPGPSLTNPVLVAAPIVHAIAVPWVREPILVHSAGVSNMTTFTSFAQCLTLSTISRR